MLDDASRPTLPQDVDANLKYDRRGAVPIILVPQPSDDPNDPLVGSDANHLQPIMADGP